MGFINWKVSCLMIMVVKSFVYGWRMLMCVVLNNVWNVKN